MLSNVAIVVYVCIHFYLVDVLEAEFISTTKQNLQQTKRNNTAFLHRMYVGEFLGPSLSKVIV